ncbi:MAG: ABC transporter ATP-binding protein [Bacilli bacterium]
MNNILDIKNLSKKYNTVDGEVQAIDNINLEVKEGEVLAIVGSSGCGKSTLLSILAGLDNASSGCVCFKNNDNIGYMLQQDALLPWLSIYENAILGLKINHINDKEHLDYVNNLLKMYDLYDFKDKKPSSLSGGMKQRVALIRTLALKPKILLLDEPFSALDYQTRLVISDDVYKVAKENNITVIIVTHDLAESISMADRVVVLSKRPCIVKKIIPINLSNRSTPINNRKAIEFNMYYDLLWSELDVII